MFWFCFFQRLPYGLWVQGCPHTACLGSEHCGLGQECKGRSPQPPTGRLLTSWPPGDGLQACCLCGPPAGSSGLARPFLNCRLSPGVEEALAPGGSPPRRLHRAPCTSIFHLAQKWLKHCPRHPCDNVIGLGARGRAVRDVPLSDGELSLPHSRMERGASQQCPYR